MIAYLDSSVLARAYLADEDGHDAAAALSRAQPCWKSGKRMAFATRDDEQAAVAELLGFARL
jgi:hypothetical protein